MPDLTLSATPVVPVDPLAPITPITPITPIALLRLSRTEAQARTTIAQRAIDLPLRLGTAQWRTRLVPVIAPEPLWRSSTGTWLHFEWAGAVFALQLPPAAIEQVLAAGLDHALLPELSPELMALVLEASLADLLQALQALGRGAPQRMESSNFHTDAALPAHAFDVWLHASDGPEAIAARLHADGLGLLLLAGLLAQRPPLLRSVRDTVPVPMLLRAELGCTRISLDELHALSLADVVLLDSNFIGAQRSLWLSADGQAGLYVQLPAIQTPSTSTSTPTSTSQAATSDFLTVLHSWSALMSAPAPLDSADGATATTATTAAATLQALPVRLSFDLGEVSLSLAQLQALQPGQTLSLGHPLTGAVRIRANGALVGEGDLVEIDGQLGISVRTLFGSRAA